MQLAGEIFDDRDNARRRTNDGIAGNGKTAIAHGVENLPARAIRQRFKIVTGAGMRSGEDEIIRLKTRNLFEADLRPILVRIDDGDRSGPANRVGDESVFSNGHERLRPDNEKHAAGRHRAEFRLQSRQALLKIVGEGLSRRGDVQDVGKFLRGGNNLIDGASIGGIGGNTESVEGANGFQQVAFLGKKNEVRVQRGDFLEIGIDDAADFRFLLRIRRVVTIIRVADETIFDAESVDGFRQAWRQRNDSRRIHGDANGAPVSVDDFMDRRANGERACSPARQFPGVKKKQKQRKESRRACNKLALESSTNLP